MSDAVLSQFKQEEAKEEIKADRKIKVGIIGTGGISEGHITSYLQMPDVEIIAACDLIPTKAESVMHDYHGVKNCRCYLNHKEMIDNEPELDLVSICTYNTQHAGPAIYALEHGLHVILEKPFTVTLDEAIEVMRAEKKSGKILSKRCRGGGDLNFAAGKRFVKLLPTKLLPIEPDRKISSIAEIGVCLHIIGNTEFFENLFGQVAGGICQNHKILHKNSSPLLNLFTERRFG